MSEIPESAEKEEGKKRILIIDDETSLTTMMRINLEQTGRYEVNEVNISTHAIDTIFEFEPDLIILDVMMPELDGADILYQIKNDPRLSEIPLIFHTSTVRKTEVENRGGHISGFPFIPKPSKFEDVIKIIEENLEKSE